MLCIVPHEKQNQIEGKIVYLTHMPDSRFSEYVVIFIEELLHSRPWAIRKCIDK